ncbi:hypothetical protein RhiirA5_424833 [Rhizophagus irregularis]|uniref:Ion transport domain-containing protein n=1 Tax=Rhizophagus irregularis TaxID=588596 RepID=A0A2N0P795_9GLOM|nr:hypothetical protein RhiirA5_424833 [Rhizophagus irregularis]
MTTVIIHACKSLAYLHRHTKSNISKDKHQKFVSGITKFIKDFIRKYPDNWKLMEVQYPLMAYLIYSRSFSLIKYVLFENAEKLHKPQSKYVSYPYYNDLKLYEDFKFNNEDLKLNDEDLKSVNDLELTLEFREDQDTVILAYLLEYYTENSMTHIGWMINVTKILPKLLANYMELLYYKPCFGGINYKFPNKRFKELSVSEDNLKVYMPLTQLKTTKSLTFSEYKLIGDEELHNIYMVPLPNFTTYNTKNYKKNLSDKYLSPFLQINKKNKGVFFNVPVMEAVITSRWKKTKNYWMIPLLFYSTFLVLFEFSNFINDDNSEIIKIKNNFIIILNKIHTGIFYYTGMLVLFAHPSFLNLIPSASNFTLNNGTTNLTLTGESPDNPFDTIWDAILSAYYWNTINLSPYHYWPLKLLAFITNVILVLVLLNMIVALMNDTFNKAKEDGKLGLLVYGTELINDYERLDYPFFTKLYSWYNDEDVGKEEITFDNEVDISPWYAFITGNESLNSASSSSTPDHLTLWF